MKSAIELSIKGIKCDNPECDFRDDEVKFEEYENWLNKPCPKCGQILLTQADYDNTKLLIDITSTLNNILPQRDEKEEVACMSVDMDGSGKMDIKMKDMKCPYYREEGYCSKDNHSVDTSDMGECIYPNGEISDKASIHCSEGMKLLGIKIK